MTGIEIFAQDFWRWISYGQDLKLKPCREGWGIAYGIGVADGGPCRMGTVQSHAVMIGLAIS